MKRLAGVLACAMLLAAQTPPKTRLKWESRVKYGPAWEGVPEPYRKLPFPEMPIPATRADWEKRRPEIRKVLYECLGDMPARPRSLQARTIERQKRQGYAVEKVEIDNGFDSMIPGYLVIPDGLKGRSPAILLLHWHSGDKAGPLFSDQVQNVLEPLVKRGFILFSIDANFNGERLGQGPAGAVESSIDNQRDTLFKLHLWFGRTLWGMMLRDDMIAIDYLVSRPARGARSPSGQAAASALAAVPTMRGDPVAATRSASRNGNSRGVTPLNCPWRDIASNSSRRLRCSGVSGRAEVSSRHNLRTRPGA